MKDIRRNRLNTYALVIDDDEAYRSSLAMMLRICGFNHVETAGDGELGLQMMGKWRYDLVMCDWNMDPVDGLQVLRAVKASPALSAMPFVLMTASMSETAWRGAIELGADDFLVKPFDLGTLRETCRLLEQHIQTSIPENVIPLFRRAL